MTAASPAAFIPLPRPYRPLVPARVPAGPRARPRWVPVRLGRDGAGQQGLVPMDRALASFEEARRVVERNSGALHGPAYGLVGDEPSEETAALRAAHVPLFAPPPAPVADESAATPPAPVQPEVPAPRAAAESETRAPSPLDAALAYAARGWPVLPVEPGGKRPLTPRGVQDATTDPGMIRQWWQQHPGANVAVATGAASGLVVLDVDPRHGGEATLAALEREHGPLPATVGAETGGGGRHVYLAHPGVTVGNSTGRLGPGLDVKADGGYVVAPPSRHASGRPYTWTAPPETTPLAPPPGWLLAALGAQRRLASAPQDDNREGGQSTEPIPQGRRNTTLARIAGALRRQGASPEAIEAALLAENAARCQPPLGDDEVRRVAAAVARYAPDDTAADGPVVVRLDTVTPEAVTWLWPGRIPRGKLTLVVGDPGLGKSTALLDFAARVSIGGRLPDGGGAPAGDVVLLTAEDGLADTVRPRLEAAGGDCTRVHVLTALRRRGQERPVSLVEADLVQLEGVVRDVRPVLVIVDPLSAYLGKVDSNTDAAVRGVLAPLARLAETLGVAVVAVMHLNKSQTQALYRPGGSIAFVAQARSVLGVVADPDREGRRLLVSLKNNLAEAPRALAFRIAATPGGVASVEWMGQLATPGNVEALLRTPDAGERSAVEEAAAFLRETLAEGPRPARTVAADARELGISVAALNRARRRLGVRTVRRGAPGGRRGEGGWWWRLPNQEDQGDQGDQAEADTTPYPDPEDSPGYD
jgi:hypothetical protein